MAFFLLLTAGNMFNASSSSAESVEELAGRGEVAGNVEKLILDLEELKKQKIPLNTAGADVLRQLPWLGSADIRAIRRERKKAPLTSLNQLAAIIGTWRAEAVAPYIVFDAVEKPRKKKAPDDFSGTFTSRVFREIPLRRGVTDGKYAAEAQKLYSRLKLSFSSYTLALVQERDIGEPELFDFTSMSLGAAGTGIVRTAVLGNYEVNLGEGLVIGQGRYYAGGADVPSSVRLSAKRLSPYASSSEYGFFQGAAAVLALAPCELAVFCSANRVDAVINANSGMITSFDDSGYHRTGTERGRKDNVTERVYGANLRYGFKSGIVEGKIGGSWVRYDYALPLKKLEGASSSVLAGIEGEAVIGRFGLFGEAAWAEKPANSLSWTAGTEYEPVRGVNLLLALRSYGTGYYSPFASAFAERGEHGENEQGIHAGAGFRLSERLSLSGYYDWFRFPLLDDHCLFPSDGHDTRVYLCWKAGRKVSWDLQLQHRYKEEEKNQGTSKFPLWTALPKITMRGRLSCDVGLPGNVRLRTLGELKRAERRYLAGDEAYGGWLLYQQAGVNGKRFSLKGRFTIFDVRDYDAAIYVYEDDLPQTFSTGMYNGRGRSLILLCSWEPSKELKLAGRYEKSWYDDRQSTGDGSDTRATGSPASFHLGAYLKF
jgi:hypothetical protein